VPATVAATCVPCPNRSTVSGLALKFRVAPIFPARSGWPASTPVSSTATLTPRPSKPACQAAGAPICAVLRSSAALTRPSSQMCAPFDIAAEPWARAATWVRQKSARSSLSVRVATAPMLASWRPPAAPSRPAGAPWTISGRVAEAASP